MYEYTNGINRWSSSQDRKEAAEEEPEEPEEEPEAAGGS